MISGAGIVVLTVSLFAGCQKVRTGQNSPVSVVNSQRAHSTESEKRLRLGEISSLTGSEATFGRSTHRGILLAVQEANQDGGVRGRKLELITQDDRGQASEAVLAIQKLIQQHQVLGILGEVASSISLAIAPIAQSSHVPMITPSSIHSKVTQQGDYIFRVCFLDQFQSKVMTDFALKKLKAGKVAILKDVRSDYSQDSARLFKENFEREGGQVVMEQSYSAGDMDFKAQLTAIRAIRPDLIVIPGYYTEVGLISRQKRELGIQVPLLGGDGWDSSRLQEVGGSALEGSYFVSHYWPQDPSKQVQRFEANFKAAFGGDAPDGLAALGFDAANIMIEAFRRSERWDGESLKTTISQIRDFSGVTGKITIGPDRNAIKRAIVFKLGTGGKPAWFASYVGAVAGSIEGSVEE